MKLLNSLKLLSCAIALILGFGIPQESAAYRELNAEDYRTIDHKRRSGKSGAAARAQAQYGGKVLSVSESSNNGQKVYRVKLLLDSGRIKIVTIKGK